MFKIDLHIHTNASCHAYSSIYENIMVAKKKKLKLIGITDHGPQLDDSPHKWHFMNMRAVPEYIDGIRILKGIESNILGLNGNIDCDVEMFNSLDFVIAGFHSPLFMPMDIDSNTEAIINTIKNPIVSIISHPDNPLYPIHFDKVAKAASENHVALEVNSGSLTARPGSEQICPDMLKAVEKYGGYISLGSDAHFCSRVGDLDYCESILAQLKFNKSKVLNSGVSNVMKFIEVKKSKIEGDK